MLAHSALLNQPLHFQQKPGITQRKLRWTSEMQDKNPAKKVLSANTAFGTHAHPGNIRPNQSIQAVSLVLQGTTNNIREIQLAVRTAPLATLS
jgi:hypothetical protein